MRRGLASNWALIPSATPWPSVPGPADVSNSHPHTFFRLKISPAGQGIGVLHMGCFGVFWYEPVCWSGRPLQQRTLRSQVPEEVWRITRVSCLVKAPMIRGDLPPVITEWGQRRVTLIGLAQRAASGHRAPFSGTREFGGFRQKADRRQLQRRWANLVDRHYGAVLLRSMHPHVPPESASYHVHQIRH